MDNRKSMGRMLAILFLPSLIIGCTKSNEDDITGATWEGREVEKPALAVDVLKVAEGQLVPLVETSGLVEGINQAVVVAQNLGTIEAIFVEIGEKVTKDMVLLEMDDSVARLKLEQAREQMENARIVLEAQELLRNSGGVSQAELLRSRSSYRGAQAFYETSLKSFEDTALKSPIEGVLAWKTLELEVGNYLSPGQTVYRVADLSGLRITLSVGERQVGLIETGAEVRITIPSALGTGEILGQVKAVGAGAMRLPDPTLSLSSRGIPTDRQ